MSTFTLKQETRKLIIQKDGKHYLSEERYCYSSSDKTPEDALNCVNYRYDENKLAAQKVNREQLQKFEHIVACLNAGD